MKKKSLSIVGNNIKTTVVKHTPEILMGFGVAGMVTSAVMAVKATPKALQLIEEKKKEDGVDKLSVKDTIKVTYKCYIPSVTVGLASTACLIGSSSISLKRNAVLATAYKVAENAHKEYRDKVVETIGKEQEKVVQEKVSQEQVNKDPVGNREVIITSKGDTLCYDALSGRYFKSDSDYICRIVNELNRRMRSENYISLNEFYEAIGLKRIKIGDDLGWNIDKGYIDIWFSSALTDNDEPCLVINFDNSPKYGYSSFF